MYDKHEVRVVDEFGKCPKPGRYKVLRTEVEVVSSRIEGFGEQSRRADRTVTYQYVQTIESIP